MEPLDLLRITLKNKTLHNTYIGHESGVLSFGMIQIRISDQISLIVHQRIRRICSELGFLCSFDASCDAPPSDPGSVILIWIIPKEAPLD